MKQLSRGEVHAQKASELGLDASALDLTSVEALAGALRRAAGFLCPCPAASLVRGVVAPLRGLVDDLGALKEAAEATLEMMIAHGDILEQRDVEVDAPGGAAVLLYAAPPAFVPRESGMMILLGIAPGQVSALPDDLAARIEYVSHVRRLSPLAGEDLRSDCTQLGLLEIPYAAWLKSPPSRTAAEHVARLDSMLDAAVPSRDVPGLSILVPERPVRYYRGRWAPPGSQTGRFVARRSQAYGADLWCYTELRDGNPQAVVDLPVGKSRWRGCDEAWHLQMAIDAVRRTPQQFSVRAGPLGTKVMMYFSPVPMWARRRWDAIGEPVMAAGSLFAYRLLEREAEEERDFARRELWLEEHNP